MSSSLIDVTPPPSSRTSIEPRYRPLDTLFSAGPSRRIGSAPLNLTDDAAKLNTRFPRSFVMTMPAPPRLAT